MIIVLRVPKVAKGRAERSYRIENPSLSFCLAAFSLRLRGAPANSAFSVPRQPILSGHQNLDGPARCLYRLDRCCRSLSDLKIEFCLHLTAGEQPHAIALAT